jgi:DNA-binding NtrC family response regulator
MPTLRSRRVLVVEDDPGLCDAVSRLLEGVVPEVRQAQSAEQAFAALEAAPDLVITDLRLRGVSAFPVVEAALRRRPPPVVVAMSGQASAEESFRLGQLGVRAYLPKPFSSDAIFAAIERAEREGTPAFESVPASADPAPAPRGRGRLRRALARLGWRWRGPAPRAPR